MLRARLGETLTGAHGLPERDWKWHMIYAPALNTGHAAKTWPECGRPSKSAGVTRPINTHAIGAYSLNAYRVALERVLRFRP
jgi:hypothetical protein